MISLPLPCELLNNRFQLAQLLPQLGVLRTRLFQFLVQALDGRQRHAFLVHSGDVLVIRAVQAKGRVKILGHGAEVPRAIRLRLVFPFRDRQRRNFLQHRAWIDGGESLF